MNFSFCIIGNSHVAAIKQAWSNRAPALNSGVTVDFFSAGTTLLPHLTLDGTIWRCANERLREKIAYTSDGKECIDLSRYDAFVLVGCGFGLDIPKFTEGYDLASATREPEGTLLSRSCFAAIVEARLLGSLALQLIGTIKSASNKPVLLCAAPYLSERVLNDEDQFQGQMRFQDSHFLNSLVAAAKDAGARISAEHGFTLIWQDEETVGRPGFTKAVYGLNPIRFTMRGRLPPVDRKHGNEDYGFIMLMKILSSLHVLSGERVLAEAPTDNPARTIIDNSAQGDISRDTVIL